MRSLVSLGDVVRACGHLRPDADTLPQVLAMLAYEAARPPAAIEGRGFDDASKRILPPPPAPAPELAPQPQAPMPAASARTPAMLEARSTRGPVRPSWLTDTIPIARATRPPMREPPPLFGDGRARAIVTAVASTSMPGNAIDVDRVVDVVAQGWPLHHVPRLPVLTLRRGVQVLVDVAAGMDPYRGDQRFMLGVLRRLLGGDRLYVRYFAGCPSRGLGPGRRDSWEGWRSPGLDVPVLALTDAGIGAVRMDDGYAVPEEWLAFAATVRSAGNSLVALVPFVSARWPAALARAMWLVHMSEKLTVSDVRRMLGPVRGNRQ